MGNNSETRNLASARSSNYSSARIQNNRRNKRRSRHNVILGLIIVSLIVIVLIALVFIICDFVKNKRAQAGVDSSAITTEIVTTAVNQDFRAASRAIDGDDSTYMLSGESQRTGSYILLDLGTETDVMSVEVISNDVTRYVRRADIQISSDKSTWKTIGEFVGEPSKATPQFISKGISVKAAYIRFILTEKCDELWLVNTIRVFNPDGNEITVRAAMPGILTSDVTVTHAPDLTSGIPSGVTVLYKSNALIYEGDLILVNNQHEYIFPQSEADVLTMYGNRTEFTDAEGKTVYSYKIGDIPLTCLKASALKHFNDMADAFYKETGKSILHVGTNAGWRSKATQAELAAKYSTALAAGLSEHNTGLAANIDLYIDDKVYSLSDSALLAECGQVLMWLNQNAYKYGFVDRYPAAKDSITGLSIDRYHYRYVGFPHAYYMTQHNLCLEEYIDLLGKYSYEGEHLCFTGDDGNSYEIYTIKADITSTATQVYVPTSLPYTISGDNIGNFIITITK